MKKYQNYLSENFPFLVVNFSIYLNRRIFVIGRTPRLIWVFTRYISHYWFVKRWVMTNENFLNTFRNLMPSTIGENIQQTTYWNIIFLFFKGNRFWHFKQIVSNCLRVHRSFRKSSHAVAITYKHDTNPDNSKQIQQLDKCAQQRLRSAWASSRRSAWKYLELSATQMSENWSHWADALADLSLSWTYRSNDCFVMCRLK